MLLSVENSEFVLEEDIVVEPELPLYEDIPLEEIEQRLILLSQVSFPHVFSFSVGDCTYSSFGLVDYQSLIQLTTCFAFLYYDITACDDIYELLSQTYSIYFASQSDFLWLILISESWGVTKWWLMQVQLRILES